MTVLCAGAGENGYRATGCNGYGGCGSCGRGCCGFWQIDCSWQTQHDYTDVYYWTTRALKDGFWSYGGILSIAANHPDYSPGYIANMCQGAYSDLVQGGNYYNQYQAEAQAAYDTYWSGVARRAHGLGEGGGGGGTPAPTPGPPILIDSGPYNLIAQLDFAGLDINLWKALEAAGVAVASSAHGYLLQVQKTVYVNPHKAG